MTPHQASLRRQALATALSIAAETDSGASRSTRGRLPRTLSTERMMEALTQPPRQKPLQVFHPNAR